MNEDDRWKYGFGSMATPSRFGSNPTKKTAELVHGAVGETTELDDVKVTAPSSHHAATSTPSTAHTGSENATPCKNGGCKTWRSSRLGGGEPRTESPWHSLKTVFLVSVIVAFLVWIIVYAILDQYRIL
ncbi:uncharacterized protein LOC105838971 isoform X2 [Monomorium pharaonis]|uniref:uncharacterized protein LOC105838971 isoform X2 n=1 Tax=Monomorium pharaonis TaxID=307658 RepID=UPI00063EE2CE|nr:uncharacterized protein LOC105838971 isoform X2 [Monomorium pharaonis]